MRPLIGQNQHVAKLVSEIAGIDLANFGQYSTIGVIDEKGRLIGGLVYFNWDRKAECIEIAGGALSRRWLTRPILQLMHDYPFMQLGCQIIAYRTSAANEHVNAILRRFGYNEIRIPRLRGRDEDEIVFTMTDDQWLAHPRNTQAMKEAA